MNRISRDLARALTAVLIVAAHLPVTGQSVALIPNHLRTETREAPLSVDTRAPRLSWMLHAISDETRGEKQFAYRVLAASSPEKLKFDEGDLWDSGRVVSSKYWQIRYGGKPLNSRQAVHWKVQVWSSDSPGAQPGPWSEMGSFTVGLLHESDWTAHWIAAEPDKARARQALETDRTLLDHMPPPLPVFRHDITLRKPVKQALLYVSGLGQYEFRINGSNVTKTVLNPGWTDYRKTINYDTYDVAHLLHSGANALGAMLGNGMYNVEGVKGRYTKFIGSFGQPKLIAQLEVTYADGSTQTFSTDRSWKSNPGPIVFSSTYGGEDYDARTLPENWDQPAFDMHAWQHVYEVDGPGGRLHPSKNVPLVIAETRKPVRITQRGEGVAVYDLGANMSGWPSITVKGQSGGRVILRAGELLTADGDVTQHSADAGPGRAVLFQYTLRGTRLPERWSPRFSYYGFRYIEVTVQPATPGGAPPEVLTLNGEFVHAGVETIGKFNSSNTLYNRIHTLIDQAVLSNVASVLTDCPHREKLGWLEQTYLNASTLMLNYDMSGLYEKMSDDMADSQLPSGLVPEIAPEYVAFVDAKRRNTDFRDSPEWGSAVVLSPWALYQFTGDEEPLRAHYASMKRYVEYLRSRSVNSLLDFGLGDWYDIGPKPPGEAQLTSKLLTASATYYEDLVTIARVAAMLGNRGDASLYQRQADTVRGAFNAKLFHPETNEYDRGSQTANAMPLALGMVPPEHIRDVLANLVANIHSHSDHVTAGDVGFHYVVRALTDCGRSDVLAAMLARTDPPSYGDQLERGATTLTEAWDTNPDSSQNHFMLGHGEEWLYRGLAGLSLDLSRGDDSAISISPHFVSGVDWVTASYRAPMGDIAVHWERSGHKASLDIVIPEGAAASVAFPPATQWDEGGRKLGDVRGLENSRKVADAQTVHIGSGKYHFRTDTLQR
ncbi:MAG TPA: family 78 glycoside hydrolase catalytic domain [Terracidiphilus sp.]|nr:family 78 glycoside hydrolase catalytic domain [Terracidiphilus sp.]